MNIHNVLRIQSTDKSETPDDSLVGCPRTCVFKHEEPGNHNGLLEGLSLGARSNGPGTFLELRLNTGHRVTNLLL